LPRSTAEAIRMAMTALPVENTGTSVRSDMGSAREASAWPAQMSITVSPSITTEKRAPCSFSPSGASTKLAAKASFTAAR